MENTKNKARYWLVVLGACLLMVGVSLGTTCLSFFVTPVTEALGYQRGAFTLYVSLITLTSVITMPMLGKMIIQYGVRKIVLIGGIWSAVGFAWLSFSKSLISFYLAGAFMGLIFFGCTTLAAVIIVNMWFLAKKGTVMGIVMACSGIGGAVFGMFLPGFINNYGWENGYMLLAGCILVCTVPVALFLLKNSPQEVGLMPYGYSEVNKAERNVPSGKISGVPYKKALKTNQLYVFYLALVLLSMVLAVLQHLPAHFVANGLSPVQAGSLMSILMMALIFAKILLGIMNDRLGTILTFGIVAAVYLVSLFLLPIASYGILVISMILMSMGNGSMTVLPPLMTAQIFGQKDYAGIWAIFATAGSVGMTIGTPLWGVIFDRTGSYLAGIYGGVAIIVLVFLLIVYCIKSGAKLEHES